MEGEYYKTKESVQEYIQAAKGFDGKELIEKLAKFLPKDTTVLELGSGPGSDWAILDKSYQVTGSDNSSEFLRLLRSKNPNHEFLELDATTIVTDKRFDGIYSNKVLHHLTDVELQRSIQRQHEILSSGGVICHSFWKGEGSEVFNGLFVNYHEEEEIRAFFGRQFEVLLVENYEEFEPGDSVLLIGKRIA